MELKRYDINNFIGITIESKDIEILTNIGLPIINNEYYSFKPTKKIFTKKIKDISYIVLGRSFSYFNDKNVNIDDEMLILLNPLTREILLYSEMYYKIGRSKSIFWTVNSNINIFLKFQEYIIEFINKIFFSTILVDLEVVILEFRYIIKEFIQLDIKKLDLFGIDNESYWRSILYEILYELENIYGTPIIVDTLIEKY